MFKKFLLLLASLAGVFIFSSKLANAEGEFFTDVNVEYRIEVSGKTQVINTITLENVFSNLYATSYSLVLDNIEATGTKVYEGARQLSFSQKKEQDKTTISINFDDARVGKGKARTFVVSYQNDSFVQRTGEVWEIAIPRLGNDASFRSYSLTLSVPSSFGTEAYISPKAREVKRDDGRLVYYFDKTAVAKTGITAGFGAFQVFSFNLSYHLENPLAKYATIDIALPPDTGMQRVYYQLVNPRPQNVYVDEDGNWLATYLLKPRERVDVSAAGEVQIFAGPRPFVKPTPETLKENLKETQYWQTSDTQIKDLAQRLQTAKNIYDYVSETLSYDYERVKPNISRLGAKAALNQPKNAICMEFTDLFIALARSAGIPAREINGYAYTENPKIQPLSLVADVLHSWPEYWSEEKKSWIPVDPTWASTTGGVDYFNKLDLRHFTFVIHGRDPVKPYPPGSYKLGANPQKDVFVSFGQLPEERLSQPQVTIEPGRFLPFTSTMFKIIVKNPGPTALYTLSPTVFLDNKFSEKSDITILPPYGSYELTSFIPFSFLATQTPSSISVLVGDKRVEFPTYKNKVIVYNLLTLSILMATAVVFILFKLKRIQISAIWFKIVRIFKKNGKIPDNSSQNPDRKDQL